MKHFTIKHATKALVLGLIVLAVTGCGTASNSVNNGGLIQKRKYTKGFYLNLPQRGQRTNETVTVEDVQPADEIAVIKPQQKTGDNSSLRTPLILKTENTEEAPVAMIPEKIVNEENSVTITRTASQKGFHTAQLQHSAKQPSILKQAVENQRIKQQIKKVADDGEGAVMLLLLIIFAIILPPLAVALYEGFTGRFLLDLIFWLLGISSGLIIAPWAFVFLVVAIVYALIIILGG